MLTTLHGHVELDPMRIPLAASMSTGRDDRFEQVLQQTVAADEAATTAAEPDDREQLASTDETPPVTEPVRDEAEELPPEPRSDSTEPQSADPLATSHAHLGESAADEPIRRGEPERQETAGKGTDSPRTSPTPRSSEPLLVAFVQHSAQTPSAPLPVEAGRGVGAVDGVRATGSTPARGVETLPQRASATLRAPATTASYRTSSTASAELLEQARDSVFKQILMQLTGDGGEMRMRLQPPELGELDLRLVVANGNQLNLTIAAERADMTQLLERHLDELKQTLQQAGLEVTGASVQTRSEFAREQRARDEARGDGQRAATDIAPPAPTDLPRSGGYVTATGLDFWA